jgi:hypothetical protein
MTRVEVQGLSKVMAKLEKLAKWSEKDHNALVDINTRVGDVYAGSLRANIKDFGKDIKVYEKNQGPGRNPGNAPGKVRMTVKSGQLRRSVDTWLPNRNETRVLAGPKTNTMGRRKTRKNADGWFANIVEDGMFFGRKSNTKNTGVHKRSKMATQGRMEKLHVRLLRNRFERYMS